MDQIWIDTLIFAGWFLASYLVVRFMPTSDNTYKND
jgi:rhamnogalacturonyl hydrolase YesR